MTEDIEPGRCSAITRAGNQCKNMAVIGSGYCFRHQPDGAVSPPARTQDEETSEQELRQQLIAELDDLIARVHAISPEYTPPSFTPQKMVELMAEDNEEVSPSMRLAILKRLRGAINEDLLDIETWKGMWYMANYTIEYQGDILKRRLKGDYETDEWGLDWEFLEAVRPFLDFLYKVYWRVVVTGIEHIPDYERALLVSNHSGQLPWNAAMVMTAILNEHPAQRLVRNLYADWFPTIPYLSSMLVKMGQALASVENGIRLLEQDELVGVYPEAYTLKVGLFREQYKLARFGRGGFVKMALNTQAPIIPVSVVGAEETRLSIAKSTRLARKTGFPFLPNTLRYPWFGFLGLMPFPTKLYIDFGEPIPTADYGPDAMEDLVLVSKMTDQVRNTVQEMIDYRLAERKSLFK